MAKKEVKVKAHTQEKLSLESPLLLGHILLKRTVVRKTAVVVRSYFVRKRRALCQ